MVTLKAVASEAQRQGRPLGAPLPGLATHPTLDERMDRLRKDLALVDLPVGFVDLQRASELLLPTRTVDELATELDRLGKAMSGRRATAAVEREMRRQFHEVRDEWMKAKEASEASASGELARAAGEVGDYRGYAVVLLRPELTAPGVDLTDDTVALYRKEHGLGVRDQRPGGSTRSAGEGSPEPARR